MLVSQSAHMRGGSTRPLRSKLGCKTCKTRRVKCGEEKPKCLRCTSTGRKCEYESTICRTSFSTAAPPMSIFENPLSLLPNTVWRERRAFAYYFQYAAEFIGGGLDADFWHTIVPQVCRSEPAMWDAMITISSLFESPDPCPDFTSLRQANSRALNQSQVDALGWYSRSVSALRQRIERGDVDTFVGLITCILFICIEALLGSAEEALQLYGQGVHLILALQAQISSGALTTTKASSLTDTIIPIFVRLGALSLHNSRPLVRILLQESEHAYIQEFASLKSARETIVTLAIEVGLFEFSCEEYLLHSNTSHISQELIDQQRALSARLQRWHSGFTKLMESLRMKDIPSPLQVSTGAVLLTYYEMLSIILMVCISPSRITTDDFIQNFQNIVEQSNMALSGSVRSNGTQPPFTFEISIGLPLWFTCLRCREPTIRRTALALLRQAHQVQGLYKREHGATMGETVMMVEEMYGMAMNTAQSTVNLGALRAKNALVEHGQILSLMQMEIGTSAAATAAAAVFIPHEARVKLLGVFRPRDGYPPGITAEDIARWNGSHDQTLLYFSRNEHSNNVWRTIYEYVPIYF